MEFEWDPKKARANFRKHGVSFADAVSVLTDELAITIEDIEHDEQRFVTLGTDAFGRLLIVVYSYREDRIRFVSARKATPSEQEQYER